MIAKTRIAGLAIWLFLVTGCSNRRLEPVDPDLARQSLVEALDIWQHGGLITEMRVHTPEIVVQEAAWSDGASLVQYRLLDDGRVEDANMFFEVELTLLKSGMDKPINKTVTYVVGTAPVITVFRAIL
jgi:hypothetical protein